MTGNLENRVKGMKVKVDNEKAAKHNLGKNLVGIVKPYGKVFRVVYKSKEYTISGSTPDIGGESVKDPKLVRTLYMLVDEYLQKNESDYAKRKAFERSADKAVKRARIVGINVRTNLADYTGEG